ncbi:ABC transporter permease [Ancylomarina sp. 16SWW S1-10-2]|uniref:ABC transporter permease n=1 Tax=Ancylomarina sp. 16SWW S1-10-2 TaxID=2499681 RepID=UPI0012ADA84E|nr:ABC transporter permease [Ancylomarina sp. 16SWW S1-10-2]MRT93588.1 ABC transporter permease [Ancylomarina sp. 16SWW S1-10-2]
MLRYLIQGLRMTGQFFITELRAIIKDAGVLLLFVVAIVAYSIIYSTAYSNEVLREMPVAVVDHDNSALSRQYSRMVDASEQLDVVKKVMSMHEAKQSFYAGEVRGVVLIPADFEKDIFKGIQTSVSIYGDASYFLVYKQTLSGASFATGTLSAGVEVNKLLADGDHMEQALNQRDPLSIKTYKLYNPSSGYGSFLMPGLILIILQQTLLIGIGMIGGTRKERFSNHYQLPKDLQKGQIAPIIFGKVGAYMSIYLMDSVFALILIHYWFGFPDKANMLDVFTLLIPFLLAVSFLGLAISVLFKRREHSLMFLLFLSPAVLFLSGLSWPATEIPSFLYSLAHVFPSTLMIPAYLRIRTMGVGLSDVSFELLFMMGQVVVYFVLAYVAFRYSLSRIKKS